MKNYTLLIIDDEWKDREKSYIELFGSYYNLIFIKDPITDVSLINNPSLDAIVLDLDLSKFGVVATSQYQPNPSYFEHFLGRIRDSKPVILTSSKFNELATWVNKTRQYQVQVLDLFSWGEVFDHTNTLRQPLENNGLLHRISFNLDEYYNRTHYKKTLNEDVNILHISDLQFGDLNYSDEALLNDLDLAIFLNNNEIKLDFIAITGDIAYSGLPSEYQDALKWINNFCKNVFPKNMNFQERLLLVPGNHDVNVYLTAADIYTFNFSPINNHSINVENPSELSYIKKRDTVLNDQHRSFGLLPFREFAFRLTGDVNWFHQYSDNDLCWCNDRFLDWGIRFVILNTVTDLTYKDPNYSGIRTEVLDRFARKIDEKDRQFQHQKNKFYTIYLCHNDPYDMGFANDGREIQKVPQELFRFINAVGGNLYLHGHRHMATNNFEHIRVPGQFTEDLNYVLASTLTLNKKVRQADKRRGFNVITLKREAGVVISAILRPFEVTGAGIIEVASRKPRIAVR